MGKALGLSPAEAERAQCRQRHAVYHTQRAMLQAVQHLAAGGFPLQVCLDPPDSSMLNFKPKDLAALAAAGGEDAAVPSGHLAKLRHDLNQVLAYKSRDIPDYSEAGLAAQAAAKELKRLKAIEEAAAAKQAKMGRRQLVASSSSHTGRGVKPVTLALSAASPSSLKPVAVGKPSSSALVEMDEKAADKAEAKELVLLEKEAKEKGDELALAKFNTLTFTRQQRKAAQKERRRREKLKEELGESEAAPEPPRPLLAPSRPTFDKAYEYRSALSTWDIYNTGQLAESIH